MFLYDYAVLGQDSFSLASNARQYPRVGSYNKHELWYLMDMVIFKQFPYFFPCSIVCLCSALNTKEGDGVGQGNGVWVQVMLCV